MLVAVQRHLQPEMLVCPDPRVQREVWQRGCLGLSSHIQGGWNRGAGFPVEYYLTLKRTKVMIYNITRETLGNYYPKSKKSVMKNYILPTYYMVLCI